ncbi:uncharacterized protein PG986_000538 [Apiospora aurea]|uniref:Uncharacterized protein n=1 Tax=Apiospora aurea TaxID=335848 RepID=A0ABR1QUA2_9PEZI
MERNLDPYAYSSIPTLGARSVPKDQGQVPQKTNEDMERKAEVKRATSSSTSTNKNGSKESSATLSYHG